MSGTCLLTLEIQSYWHIGNGKEAGAYADALVLRDFQGLPYLPGKSLKGLLREAFTLASDNRWFADAPKELVRLLFGDENRTGMEAQGLIQVTSATLTEEEQAFFSREPAARAQLFNVLASTAIDPDTGIAKTGSLRTTEVAVPMRLAARVNLNAGHPQYRANAGLLDKQFPLWLGQAVTLITELGAKRHRGLGRVVITVEPVQEAA